MMSNETLHQKSAVEVLPMEEVIHLKDAETKRTQRRTISSGLRQSGLELPEVNQIEADGVFKAVPGTAYDHSK